LIAIRNYFTFNYLYRAGSDLLNMFYPRVCMSCDELLHDGEDIICHRCMSQLPFTGFDFSDDNPVFEQLSKLVKIEYATSLFIFHQKGVVQELIHKLKYKGHQEIGKLFAELAFETYKNNANFKRIDYIIPVPLHKKKQKKRGYNQMTEFGKNLGNYLGVDYSEKIIFRSIHTESQTRKNVEERRQNVASAFEVKNPSPYAGKHFLLIDDVMTTGATLEACVRTLSGSIPDAKVSVLTMAVVYRW